MTEAELETALAVLRRSLGGAEDTADDVLTDALTAAEEEILRYLNRDELPTCADSLLIELAALRLLGGQSGAGTKSASYTEGQISQSESYFTPAELREGARALLDTLAPYRRVKCGRDAT